MGTEERRSAEGAGTSLADALDVAPSPGRLQAGADAIWRTQRDRFFLSEAKNTSRLITSFGVFVQLAIAALFWMAGYPTWRVAALIGIYVAFVMSHRFILGCTEDPAKSSSAFIQMSVAAQLFVIGSAVVTGGIYSPFVPGATVPAIISLLFFGPQAVSRWMAVGNGLLIISMAVLPGNVVGPQVASPYFTILVVVGLGWNLFMLHLAVTKLAIVASRAGESMACLREERLTDAEAQLRRLQSVGAKVAHELKNPLASIKGLCQLVARSPESERTQERLAVVASEISRMETILREYLSFSRPLEDIRPEPIELTTLARDVLDVLDGRAQQAGIELSLAGKAPAVQGDPRRLKEALINIVSNAIEATPSGGNIYLDIRSTPSAAVLEVRDNGRGIAPEDLERLGTSFFTTRPNGTGLGVVLAQGVITQHGGSLAYVSTLGKGTTATVTLPLVAGTTVTTPEPAPRAAMIEARA